MKQHLIHGGRDISGRCQSFQLLDAYRLLDTNGRTALPRRFSQNLSIGGFSANGMGQWIK